MTLATTLFSIEQAGVAAKSQCSYIAPYLNELRVHFDPGYKDPSPNFRLVEQAQSLYRTYVLQKTQVLPASLTTVEECMKLAGADYITIAPPLLEQLSSQSNSKGGVASIFDASSDQGPRSQKGCELLERAEYRFRTNFTRGTEGLQEWKQIQAINMFCNMQDKLESLMDAQVKALEHEGLVLGA